MDRFQHPQPRRVMACAAFSLILAALVSWPSSAGIGTGAAALPATTPKPIAKLEVTEPSRLLCITSVTTAGKQVKCRTVSQP
jgi:hypothetical protein